MRFINIDVPGEHFPWLHCDVFSAQISIKPPEVMPHITISAVFNDTIMLIPFKQTGTWPRSSWCVSAPQEEAKEWRGLR